MCLAAAHWARCDAVVFGASRLDAARAGFDDALLYEEIDRAPADRRVPGRTLLSEEAAQVFDEWLAKEDRVPYERSVAVQRIEGGPAVVECDTAHAQGATG